MAVGVEKVTLVRLLVPEATFAVIVGTTPVTKATGNVTASDPVTLTWPQIILNGIPSITFVLSCAAVSVLPAVNVNLPDMVSCSLDCCWA